MCIADLYDVIDIVNCNQSGKAKIPKKQRKIDLVESLLFLSPKVVADAINSVINSKKITLTLPTPYHAQEDEYIEYEDEFEDEDYDDEDPEEEDDEYEDPDLVEEESEEYEDDEDEWDEEDYDDEEEEV